MAPVFAAIAAFAAAYPVTYGLILSALSMVINRVLAPSTDKQSGRGSEQLVNYYSTEAPLALMIGRTRVGGMEVVPPSLSGLEGQYLHKVLALAGHEVDSFESVYYNNDLIDGSTIASVSGATGDGAVSGGKYSGITAIRRYNGTSTQTADYKLSNEASSTSYTSNFRGRGIAYAAIQFNYVPEVFKGVPQASFDVNGAKMYDPRQDSTVSGGSGSHRADTPSTWTYPINPNPALALGWYLLTTTGGGYDKTEINWPTFITAANTCDALVAVPFPFTTFTNVGTGTNDGRNFTKASGATGWDAGSYSTDGIKSGVLTGSLYASGTSAAFGLHTSAALPAATRDGAYMVVFGASTIVIRESGTDRLTITRTAVAGTDWARLEYTGSAVRYIVNGKIVRTVAVGTVGQNLYLNVGQNESGSGIVLGSQPRYSCNGQLFAATSPDDFIGNCKDIADAMLGRLVYTNGIWSCFAGAWQTPTFTIAKSDWCSPLSIRFDGGIGSRFNRMHTWYIDPMRNFQKVESMPRSNATYRTADGGKDLDRETDQLLCNDEYEAQRKGEFLLRQSRNQITVTGLLPPRFQDLSLLDTGSITLDDLGWSSKTFRITSIELNVDGSYMVTCQEEQSTDWTDLAVAEYNAPSQIQLPAVNQTAPSSPTSLAIVETIAGTLNFTIGAPVVLPMNTRYQIIAAPSSAGFVNSGAVVFDGDALNVYVPGTAGMNYYSARAYAGSYYSGYFPNSYGTPWLVLPKADNTFANRVVPDSEIDVGKPAYWTVESLSGITTEYVTSGGINGTGLIRIASPNSFGAIGTAISAFPHPSNAGSYGQLATVNMTLYKMDVRLRVNSYVNVGSGHPEFQFMIRHATNSGTVIPDYQYARPPIQLNRYSVGSWNDVTMYLAATNIVEQTAPSIPIFRRLGVYLYDGAGRAFNVDLDTVQVIDMGFVNAPYWNQTMTVSQHTFASQNMMAAYEFSSSGFALQVTSSNGFNLEEKYKYEIGRSLFASKVESYSSNRFFTTNIASHFLTMAGTYSLVNTLTVAGGAIGNYKITRINSYTMMVEGPGLS